MSDGSQVSTPADVPEISASRLFDPDGRDYENKIVFGEIARPEWISYLHPGDDGAEPVRMEVTISFAEENGKTRLTW
jgi:hypothetical protein